MPALIPKEVEIQRLKKIYLMVIMLGSIAASVEVDDFVDDYCTKQPSETVHLHQLIELV